jgi:hemerythrin
MLFAEGREVSMGRYWNPSFCSLVPRIDEDHQALFRLLDRVATHRRKTDLTDLNALIDQLLEYTFAHFTREEEVMDRDGYPHRDRHRQAHQTLRKAFIESLRRVSKGGQDLSAFVRHLRESFTYHFETEDLAFVTWQLRHPREERPAAGRPVGQSDLPAAGGIEMAHQVN